MVDLFAGQRTVHVASEEIRTNLALVHAAENVYEGRDTSLPIEAAYG